MPSFGTNAAKSAYGSATSAGAGFGAEAGQIGAQLVPELEREANNPTGFNPTDLNAMVVGGQQATGGATGSFSGEAVNRAARSRNNAALGGTLDELARSKMRSNSQNALDIQGANARLKESQRQAGLKGLEGVRAGDIGAELKSMSLLPEDINAYSGALKAQHDTGLFSDVLSTIGTLTGAARNPVTGKIGF